MKEKKKDNTLLRLRSHYDTLVEAGHKVCVDLDGFLYFKRVTDSVGMVLCRDDAPRGSRVRRHIGLVDQKVYVTTRLEGDQIFRKYAGWGISKFLVDSAAEIGFDWVLFILPGSKGRISVEDIQRCKTVHEGNFEVQYLVTPDKLDGAA